MQKLSMLGVKWVVASSIERGRSLLTISNVQQLKGLEAELETNNCLLTMEIPRTVNRKGQADSIPSVRPKGAHEATKLFPELLSSIQIREKGIERDQHTTKITGIQGLPYSQRKNQSTSCKAVTASLGSDMTLPKGHCLEYNCAPLVRHETCSETNGPISDVDMNLQECIGQNNFFRETASEQKIYVQVAVPIEDTGGPLTPPLKPVLKINGNMNTEVNVELYNDLSEGYRDNNIVNGFSIKESLVRQSVTTHDYDVEKLRAQSISDLILADNKDLPNMLKYDIAVTIKKPISTSNVNTTAKATKSVGQSRKKKKICQKSLLGKRSNRKSKSGAFRTIPIDTKFTRSNELNIISNLHNLADLHSDAYSPKQYSSHLADKQEHFFVNLKDDGTLILDTMGELLLLEINKINGLQVLSDTQILKLRQVIIKEQVFFENIYKINKSLLLLLLNPVMLAEELRELCNDKQGKFEVVLNKLERNIDILKKLVGSSFGDYKRKYLSDSEMKLMKDPDKLNGEILKIKGKGDKSKHYTNDVNTSPSHLLGKKISTKLGTKIPGSSVNTSNFDYSKHLLCSKYNLDEELKKLETQEKDMRLHKINHLGTTCDAESRSSPLMNYSRSFCSDLYLTEMNKKVRRLMQTSTARAHNYSEPSATSASNLYYNDDYIKSLNQSLKRYNNMLFLLHLQQSKNKPIGKACDDNMAVQANCQILADVDHDVNEVQSPPPPAPQDTQIYEREQEGTPFPQTKQSHLNHLVGSPNYIRSTWGVSSTSCHKSMDTLLYDSIRGNSDICNKFKFEKNHEDFNMQMSQTLALSTTKVSNNLASDISDASRASSLVTSARTVSIGVNKAKIHNHLSSAHLEQRIHEQQDTVKSLEKGYILGEENVNYIIELSKNMPICSVYENKSIFNILIDDDVRILDEGFALDHNYKQRKVKFPLNQSIVNGIPTHYNRGIPDLLHTPVRAVSLTIGKIASSNYIKENNGIDELSEDQTLNHYVKNQVEYYSTPSSAVAYNSTQCFNCLEKFTDYPHCLKKQERYRNLADFEWHTTNELIENTKVDLSKFKQDYTYELHQMRSGPSQQNGSYCGGSNNDDHRFKSDSFVSVTTKSTDGLATAIDQSLGQFNNSLTTNLKSKTTSVEDEAGCSKIEHFGESDSYPILHDIHITKSSSSTDRQRKQPSTLTETNIITNGVASRKTANMKVVAVKGHKKSPKHSMTMKNCMLNEKSHVSRNIAESIKEGKTPCSLSDTGSNLCTFISSCETVSSDFCCRYKTNLNLQNFFGQEMQQPGDEDVGEDIETSEKKEIFRIEQDITATPLNMFCKITKSNKEINPNVSEENQFLKRKFPKEYSAKNDMWEGSECVSNDFSVKTSFRNQQQCDNTEETTSSTPKISNSKTVYVKDSKILRTNEIELNLPNPKSTLRETDQCFVDKEAIDCSVKNTVSVSIFSEVSQVAKDGTQNKPNGHVSRCLSRQPIDSGIHEDDDNRSQHSFRTLSSSRRQSTEDSIDTDDEYFCYELRQLEEQKNAAGKANNINNVITASIPGNTLLFSEIGQLNGVINNQEQDTIMIADKLITSENCEPDARAQQLMADVLVELKSFVKNLPAMDKEMMHSATKSSTKEPNPSETTQTGVESVKKVTDMHSAWQDCNNDDYKPAEYLNGVNPNSTAGKELICNFESVCNNDSLEFRSHMLEEIINYNPDLYVTRQNGIWKPRHSYHNNLSGSQTETMDYELYLYSSSPYASAEKSMLKSFGHEGRSGDMRQPFLPMPVPVTTALDVVKFDIDLQQDISKEVGVNTTTYPALGMDTSIMQSDEHISSYLAPLGGHTGNKETRKSIEKFANNTIPLPNAKPLQVQNTSQTTNENSAALGSSKWKLLKALKERKIEEKNNQDKIKDDEERDKNGSGSGDLVVRGSGHPGDNPFYSNIDSMPDIRPRRKSIPLVSELVDLQPSDHLSIICTDPLYVQALAIEMPLFYPKLS